MNDQSSHNSPQEFFNKWFAEPLNLVEASANEKLSELQRHPFFERSSFIPMHWAHRNNRFEIYTECQAVWTLYLLEGQENEKEPEVFLDHSVDNPNTLGIPSANVLLSGDVLVARSFSEFLLWAFINEVCDRFESKDDLAKHVSTLRFQNPYNIKEPEGINSEFPVGYGYVVTEECVFANPFGAAFLTDSSRERFIQTNVRDLASIREYQT